MSSSRASSDEERVAWIEEIENGKRRDTGPRERKNKEIGWWNALFSSNNAAKKMLDSSRRKNPKSKEPELGGKSRNSILSQDSRSTKSTGSISNSESSTGWKGTNAQFNVEVALARMSNHPADQQGIDRRAPDARWQMKNLAKWEEEEDSDGEGDGDEFDMERFRLNGFA